MAGQGLDRAFDLYRANATALANDTDAFAADLTAFGSNPIIRVSALLNTGSVLNVMETTGGVTYTHVANAGAAVTAAQTGQFDLVAIPGATYNVQLGTSQAASAWRLKLEVVN